MSNNKRPLGMLPDEQTVIARFSTTYQFDSKTETKSQAILFWGDYGYVMPSAITSNGNLYMVANHILNSRDNAARLANELSYDAVLYSLEVLTENGFTQFEIANQGMEEVAEALRGGAKVLLDAYNAEQAS